jgi:hypothetical protein
MVKAGPNGATLKMRILEIHLKADSTASGGSRTPKIFAERFDSVHPAFSPAAIC